MTISPEPHHTGHVVIDRMKRLVERAKSLLKTRLPRTFIVVISIVDYIKWLAVKTALLLKIRPPQTFVCDGRTYVYFYHRYNHTWKNERAVEIPIIWDIVSKSTGKRILEIGNVLSHYFPVSHEVLDKYEKAKRVINEDVAEFRSPDSYDLIISISTLEHVGWDETPRDPNKIVRSIENLRNHLISPRGKLLVTFPFGYNPVLDDLVRKGYIPFEKFSCLKRESKNNEWREVDWESIRACRHGKTSSRTNVLIVGSIEK